VVAVSKAVAERTPGRRGDREVTVIPNGVAVPPLPSDEDRRAARESLGVGDDELVVGNVANLRREKAHDVLLRSFSQVVARVPNARLVIVGADMGMGSALAALARALGVEDRVRFLGRRDDATQLMPGFDVFALSSRFEGLPLAMLEAMMRAVPVVSTAVGGVVDVVDDGATGMLVPGGDEARLAEALVGVLADRGLAGRLGRAGRAKAEAEYSVERMVADYERLYGEVLEEQTLGGVST
jgi:glycosyltransferase involved in cell wall biosynthesis